MRHAIAVIALWLLTLAWPAWAYQLAVGSYAVGASPTDNRDIVISPAFLPSVVVVKCDAAQAGVWSIPDLGTDQTVYFTQALSGFTNGIQAFNADGFEVGTHATVQSPSTTCYYAAFGADSHNDLATGTYVGNAPTDNRDIVTSPAFLPGLVWTARAVGGTATGGVWRATTFGTNGYFFAASTSAGDTIQALNPNGFQIGTDTRVNESGVTYAYIAIKATLNMNADGSFTGDGTSDPLVVSAVNTPTFAFIKAGTGVVACFRFGAVGDLAWNMSAATAASNRIQAFTTTGMELGTDTCVNSAATTMRWWASKQPSYRRPAARPIFFR